MRDPVSKRGVEGKAPRKQHPRLSSGSSHMCTYMHVCTQPPHVYAHTHTHPRLGSSCICTGMSTHKRREERGWARGEGARNSVSSLSCSQRVDMLEAQDENGADYCLLGLLPISVSSL